MISAAKISALLAAFAVMSTVALALADDAAELERARTSYDAGRYAEGADRFRDILNPSSGNALREPAAIERARAYYAACLIALGKNEEANDQIERILRANPLYTPDPVVFPSQVTDRFIEVKSRLKGEIEAAFRARAEAQAKTEKEQRAYVAKLQLMASQETVLVRHSRWLAALPFGVGQFQNGQDGLGYALLTTQAILAGTSIVTEVIHTQLIADYSRDPRNVDQTDFQSRLSTVSNLNLYSSLAFGIIAVGGIIQAEATFVPEVRETRVRPVPAPPAVVPTVGRVASGFVLGAQGRF